MKAIKTAPRTLLKFQLDAEAFKKLLGMPETSMIINAKRNYNGILEFTVQDVAFPHVPGVNSVDTRPTIGPDGWEWNPKYE